MLAVEAQPVTMNITKETSLDSDSSWKYCFELLNIMQI